MMMINADEKNMEYSFPKTKLVSWLCQKKKFVDVILLMRKLIRDDQDHILPSRQTSFKVS